MDKRPEQAVPGVGNQLPINETILTCISLYVCFKRLLVTLSLWELTHIFWVELFIIPSTWLIETRIFNLKSKNLLETHLLMRWTNFYFSIGLHRVRQSLSPVLFLFLFSQAKDLRNQTSLVVHWLRINLPMGGTQVPSLVQEDSTWQLATRDSLTATKTQYSQN